MKTSAHNGIRSTALKGSLALATLALLSPPGFQSAVAQTYAITDLGTLGGVWSQAHAINNFGQVVGWALNAEIYTLEFCYCECFGPCNQCCTQLNDFNCSEDPYSVYRAFLWTPSAANGMNGVLTDLGSLGGPNSSASGINPSGEVIGNADTRNKRIDQGLTGGCDHYTRESYLSGSFLWTPKRANATTGSMKTPDSPTSATSWGTSTSNRLGQVVDTMSHRALLWDSSHGWRDLNDLIVADSGWLLTEVRALNDAGQIAGTGINRSGQTHAFLLTPIPAPRLSATSILPDGQFRFTLIGEAGRSYTIQASTNLVNWMALTNFVSATGTNQFTDPTAPNYSRRFYRAVTQ